MTSRARTLDIIVGGVTANRVYYGFPIDDNKLYHADIYPEGKFDLSTVQVGKRYRIETTQMPCRVRNKKTGRTSIQNKYVWIKATEVTPQARLQTYSANQRKAREVMAAMPLVDDGSLFKL